MLHLLSAPSARVQISGRYSVALLPAAPERKAPTTQMVVPCCPPASAPVAPSAETVWVGE